MNNMDFAMFTWQDIKKYLVQKDIILLVTGSYEQHGPLLPLTTDTVIAQYIAGEVGRLAAILVAPPVSFGLSELHMAFPGTISLTETVYKRLIKELVISLYSHGFNKYVIVNGHGGNTGCLASVAVELAAELKIKRPKIFEWWQIAQVQDMIAKHFSCFELHASCPEASVYFAIEGIQGKLPTDLCSSYLMPMEQVTRLTPEGLREISPSGILGSSPDKYSVRIGKKILRMAIDACLGELEDF
jgi:creatinine amidohydrolase